nr:hypothetical protein [uncultured Mediterranean phage uvMED]
MAKLLKLRRGTTTQHASFTGAEGELTIDTTKDTAVVHDGSTQSGHTLLREDMSNLPAGTIDNADVNASAAISGTKISPDFGSQTITTTGRVLFANVYTNESDLPSASTYHGMFAHVHSTGLAYYAHAGNWIKLAKLDAPDFTGGIDVTGNITATGTIASSNITISNTQPFISFQDTDNENDFEVGNAGGTFRIRDVDAGVNRFQIQSNGTIASFGNHDFAAGIDVSGNITCSGTVDGRDVAADGTKLDGIESGATADQTKSDIDALNINADTVDSLHASNFLRSDTADTASGDITFSGGAGAISVSAGSDIRLAQNSSGWTGEYEAKIQHHSGALYIQGGSSGHYLRNSAGSNVVSVDSSGNLTATGNVTAYSDARLKTDIHTINDALSICGKLRGVSYKWIADGKAGIGVIAQEVEEVIPEVVLTKLDPNPATGEETEVKSVDYGKIVGVLINAINELKAEIDELKGGK